MQDFDIIVHTDETPDFDWAEVILDAAPPRRPGVQIITDAPPPVRVARPAPRLVQLPEASPYDDETDELFDAWTLEPAVHRALSPAPRERRWLLPVVSVAAALLTVAVPGALLAFGAQPQPAATTLPAPRLSVQVSSQLPGYQIEPVFIDVIELPQALEAEASAPKLWAPWGTRPIITPLEAPSPW